jgi:hypothetical protein
MRTSRPDPSAARLSQQDLLRALTKRGAFTREQLAQHLGCTKRRLDGWMLPASSKQARGMEDVHRQYAELLLARIDARSRLLEHDGVRKSVVHGSGIRCPGTGIEFPAVQRFTWKHGRSPAEITYTLSHYSGEYIGKAGEDLVPQLVAQPVAGVDKGWLIVNHLRNEDEADGFVQAQAYSPWMGMNPMIAEYAGQLFGLTHQPPRVGAPRLALIYRARTTVKHPLLGAVEDVHVIAVDEHGRDINYDRLYPMDD